MRRWLPLIILAIETGMRRGELLSMRWGHVDLTRRVVHLPLDVEVDDDGAVVIREERLALVGLAEDAPLELDHLVPRKLVMQARRVGATLDGARP